MLAACFPIENCYKCTMGNWSELLIRNRIFGRKICYFFRAHLIWKKKLTFNFNSIFKFWNLLVWSRYVCQHLFLSHVPLPLQMEKMFSTFILCKLALFLWGRCVSLPSSSTFFALSLCLCPTPLILARSINKRWQFREIHTEMHKMWRAIWFAIFSSNWSYASGMCFVVVVVVFSLFSCVRAPHRWRTINAVYSVFALAAQLTQCTHNMEFAYYIFVLYGVYEFIIILTYLYVDVRAHACWQMHSCIGIYREGSERQRYIYIYVHNSQWREQETCNGANCVDQLCQLLTMQHLMNEWMQKSGNGFLYVQPYILYTAQHIIWWIMN